ncbi:MAG: hypothetical protein PVH29_03885 [Candidatus Zixiibacteriota bacterium]|jgi:hypothetical protein
MSKANLLICAILAAALAASVAGADSFKAPALSGTVFAHLGYDLTSYDDADQEGAWAFDVPRVYVNVKGAVTEKLHYRVTADIGREKYSYYTYDLVYNEETGLYELEETKHTKNGKLDFYAKYAYFEVKDVITDHKIIGGIEKTPWIDNEQGIWGWRVVRKVAVDDRKYDNSADLGIGLSGKIGGGIVEHHLTFTNGAGYKGLENGLSGKAAAYRLSLFPLVNNEDLSGLSVNAFVKADNLGEKVPEGADGNPVTVYGGLLGLEHEFINFGAGYFMKSEGEGDAKVDGNVMTAYASGHFAASEGMSIHPLVRYDMYEPNTDADDDEETLIVGGVAFKFFDGNFSLIPNYQTEGYKTVNETGGVEDASEDYFYLHAQWDWK